MNIFFSRIAGVIASVLIAGATFFGYSAPVQQPLGANLPQGVAVFETALQSAITSSASSMTLAANSVTGGSTLSGFNCFTVDEGSSQAEYICGTVSGTSVTALMRGIDPVTATTTNATLQFAHRRGADVKITDFPLLQILRNQVNGNETLPNLLSYTSGTVCSASSANSNICDKHYIDTQVSAGAANANETTNGLSQLATGAQASSGTSLGSTAARLTLPASLATSTCQATGNNVMISSSTTGKLDAGCLATNGNSTYSGANTFSGGTMFTASTTNTATTTLAASSVTNNALTINTVPYQYPSTLTGIASSSSLITNGTNGVLTYGNPDWIYLNPTQQTMSTASSTYVSAILPANSLGTKGYITFTIPISNDGHSAANDATFDVGFGNATSTFTTGAVTAGSGSKNGTMTITIAANAATNSQVVEFTIQTALTGNNTTTETHSVVSSKTMSIDTTQNQLILIDARGSTTFTTDLVLGKLYR